MYLLGVTDRKVKQYLNGRKNEIISIIELITKCNARNIPAEQLSLCLFETFTFIIIIMIY